MSIRRFLVISSLVVAGGTSIMLLGGAALMIRELLWRPEYDTSNRHHDSYARVFADFHREFSRREPTPSDFVEFSQLNGGNWKTVCLFGGYAWPLGEMEALGASVSEHDRQRLEEAGRRGFRLAQVEEYEIAIAYIDPANNAKFILFRQGIGPNGKRFKGCATKPAVRISLDG